MLDCHITYIRTSNETNVVRTLWVIIYIFLITVITLLLML